MLPRVFHHHGKSKGEAAKLGGVSIDRWTKHSHQKGDSWYKRPRDEIALVTRVRKDKRKKIVESGNKRALRKLCREEKLAQQALYLFYLFIGACYDGINLCNWLCNYPCGYGRLLGLQCSTCYKLVMQYHQ